MTYRWDPNVGRYRDEAGRFVDASTVMDWARQSLQQTNIAVDKLSDLLNESVISPSDWETLFRTEIKQEWIAQYLAGRGGLEQMEYADWGYIGGKLNSQYNTYLANFLQDVRDGKLSPAQIEARARMYIDASQQAYWRAFHMAQAEAGYDEVLWVVNPSVENCPDCLAFAAMGWQKMADEPYGGCRPGSCCTQCLTNCWCHLEYRRSGE